MPLLIEPTESTLLLAGPVLPEKSTVPPCNTFTCELAAVLFPVKKSEPATLNVGVVVVNSLMTPLVAKVSVRR